MIKVFTISNISLGFFLLSRFSPFQPLNDSIKREKEVYTVFCQNCHMEDGKGTTGIHPLLAKADYLKKPSKTLIDIILNGQSGEVVVNGKKYNALMPAQDYLTIFKLPTCLITFATAGVIKYPEI